MWKERSSSDGMVDLDSSCPSLGAGGVWKQQASLHMSSQELQISRNAPFVNYSDILFKNGGIFLAII